MNQSNQITLIIKFPMLTNHMVKANVFLTINNWVINWVINWVNNYCYWSNKQICLFDYIKKKLIYKLNGLDIN